MFGKPISFKEVRKNYGLKQEQIDYLIQEFELDIISYGGEATEEFSLQLAMQLLRLKKIYYDCQVENLDWKRMIEQEFYMFKNPYINGLEEEHFEKDVYWPLKLSDVVKTKLKAISVNKPTIRQTKGVELGPVQKQMFSDGTIRVFCKDCRVQYDSPDECTHEISRKYYRVRFYVNGGKKKNLNARYPNEALSEVNKLLQDYKQSSFRTFTLDRPKKIEYLSEAIAEYVKEKQANQTSVFKDKTANTEQHLKENIRMLNRLNYFISVKMEYNKYFRLDLFEDKEIIEQLYKLIVNDVYTKEDAENKSLRHGKQVGDKKFNPTTINKMTQYFSTLINWLNKERKLGLHNPFSDEKLQLEETIDPKSMDDVQFDKLLTWMDSKPILPVHKSKKVCSKDLFWTKFVFKLQRLYGKRRDDILMLKWNDIFVHKDFWFINIKNHKVAREKKKSNMMPEPFPIPQQAMEVFIELGLKENLGKDDFIILSADKQKEIGGRFQNRKNLISKTSTAFTFFSQILFGKEFDLTNKAVRKQSFTAVSAKIGDEAYKLSHSNSAVFDKHYVDKLEKAYLIALSAA